LGKNIFRDFSRQTEGLVVEPCSGVSISSRICERKRTSDNVFIIRTTVDKYLRVKRGKLYWCFVDFEKAFDSINHEAVWFEMTKKGVSERVVSCLSNMHEGIKFCVRCVNNEVTNFVTQTKGVRQGCDLSPYLFNIFIDIIGYVSIANRMLQQSAM
jgi:hypothetical protein